MTALRLNLRQFCEIGVTNNITFRNTRISNLYHLYFTYYLKVEISICQQRKDFSIHKQYKKFYSFIMIICIINRLNFIWQMAPIIHPGGRAALDYFSFHRGPPALVFQSISINIRTSLATFKECAGTIFFRFAKAHRL
jgi:hypothetical protein